ncbi:hypothetical protein [uncultured Selenomonas sp.]|uniref:hypothetical protein n=1 Tax=uncultured Selenomonas sp. TaxID=159275 RepID=UPI0028E61E4E|nr:hypothetical protein [uncultured Selenomonas sp.]
MMKINKLGLVAAAFAASSMLIAGCGGAKTADRAPGPGALQGSYDKQDVITKENFDGLRADLSLSDLEGMYGKANLVQRTIVDGVYSSTYRFQDGPKTVDVTFAHANWLNNPLSCPKIVDMEFSEMPLLAYRATK